MTVKQNNNHALARCILSLGTRAFFNHFFHLLESFIGVDQCVIFQINREDEFSCLLCRNFSNDKTVRTAAKSYVEGGFKSDPNLNLFRSIKEGEVQLIYFEDLVARMDPAYKDNYFDELGLADKVSIITAGKDYRYYINFYRARGRAAFYNDDIFAEPGLDALLASIIVRHYELNESLRQEGSLAYLTERERAVCSAMLQGKKAEQIAAELEITANTVITYRKRAYAKLGINSRRALFALCNQ